MYEQHWAHMKSLMQFINWENANLSITKIQQLTRLGLVHKNGRKLCCYLLMFQTCKFKKRMHFLIKV